MASSSSKSPDPKSAPTKADERDQLTPSADQGDEKNQPKDQRAEAYGDQELAASTSTVTAQHFPGQPLETVADRKANEERRAEAEKLVDKAKDSEARSDADPYDVDTRPAQARLVVDTRSPEANYLTRDNIIADGVGTAVPLVPRNEFESAREHEAAEVKAEREFLSDHPGDRLVDLESDDVPGPVHGPR